MGAAENAAPADLCSRLALSRRFEDTAIRQRPDRGYSSAGIPGRMAERRTSSSRNSRRVSGSKLKRGAEMRDEAFREFDRVAGGKMRPLGTVKARELRKIFEINSGGNRVFHDSIPNLTARCRSIFENFEFARNGQTNENNFTAAGAEFLDRGSRVTEAGFDRLLHLRHESFSRNVGRRRGRSEKRDPALLNSSLQIAAGSRAFLDHPGATFPVNRLEIRRRMWRDKRTGPIWNRQAFQKLIEREFLLFEKCDMFFQRHRQILAGALRGRLRARSPNVFFRPLHRRRAGWRHK